MNKNLLIVIGIVVVAVVGIAGMAIYAGNTKTPNVEGAIFFYGQGCPHCEKVEDFIKANNVEQKVKFTKLEVYYNKGNAELLAQKAEICKIDVSKGVPVPVLWDGKTCYVGDQPIIDYLKEKIK